MTTVAELSTWQEQTRIQFPILTSHPELVYLDSAATSQKPTAVLDAVNDYLLTSNANAGRGTYGWANTTTLAIESAKNVVRTFLSDPSPESTSVELVSGTSEALRRVATDWLAGELSDGDEIVVPVRDHRANVDPWLSLVETLAADGRHIKAHPMPYDSAGDYDLERLSGLVNTSTRFVAMTHVHHVFGADMGVQRMRRVVGSDVIICLDAAQSVGHIPVSVSELDVDFVAFSGHKAMALPGTGAIWARNRYGRKFALRGWEGTPNTVGAVSLEAALTWLSDTGLERIEEHLQTLTARLEARLQEIPGITLVGCELGCRVGPNALRRIGIVAFRHDQVYCGDLGFALDGHGFMVRSNTHCQGGTSDEDGSVRVSMHAYTTADEIERFANVLSEVLT